MRDFDKLSSGMLSRGPSPGNGRGAGRPWGGIVEHTPVLWIGWVTSAAKKAGVNPQSIKLSFYGIELAIVTTRLTYGARYYWLCPICQRRREAIYYNGRVGCQRCLNLGYLSESHRPTSVWGTLDRLYSRDFPRYNPPDDVAGVIVTELKQQFTSKLEAIIAGVKVET